MIKNKIESQTVFNTERSGRFGRALYENRHMFIIPLCIIIMEIIFKICTVHSFFNLGLLFMPLYSVAFGIFINIFCSLFGERANNIIARVCLLGLAVLYSTQTVYHWCFDKYLILYSVGAGGADQIIEDGLLEQTIKTIKACALPIILYLAVAIVASVVIGKWGMSFKKKNIKVNLITFGSNIAYYFLILLLVILIPHSREVYIQTFDPNLTVGLFGLLSTEGTDLRYNVFKIGDSSKIDAPITATSSGSSSETSSNTSSAEKPTVNSTEPWVLDLDFESLAANETDSKISDLHKYFSKRTPTYKNEYTGKYKDYNLIYITAEGFSHYAIDEKLTPTLYKMYNEGYRFNNFYNPIWGVSTSDGEYVNCTGLLPKSGVWSFYRSGEQKNNMAFTMGRQFLKAGVENVYAYHNHTHSYYHRDISHPNMGYIYKGVGNGLEDKITKCWPESDLEMIEATADEYISKNRFHAYYMTVSGHLEYSFTGNSMAKKNKEAVEHLEASDAVKAYYACNIELDRAMEALLAKLKAAGVAEKTLIVIAADHYPYGLEDKESENKYHYFDELAGHSVETNFELYKSALIMYSPSMKQGVDVDKVCSSIDIIPTLSNLFGFEYDSRLLMGRDIFSNSSPLAVFSNRSFITDKGKYNSVTRTFTPNPGVVLEDEEKYVNEMKKEVNNMFVASSGILDNDYYGIVLGTKTTN
ncbi:MAG: LTA synthase family protein [Clostridia bacterium]|nr:LTA synthase family protein [Clostridia bacterium]